MFIKLTFKLFKKLPLFRTLRNRNLPLLMRLFEPQLNVAFDVNMRLTKTLDIIRAHVDLAFSYYM